jgi:hypothetical protein
MTVSESPACQCPPCQQGIEHPDRAFHHQLTLLFSRLEEHQRRWFAALEANRLGRGGARLLSQITGLDEKTIRRGQRELAGELAEAPPRRVRRPGGGRPRVEKKIRPS